jgi:plasmid replication initiation protein
MLIGAVYKASLIENKMLALALSCVGNAGKGTESVLYANEIAKYTGWSSGSFYSSLKKCIVAMTSLYISDCVNNCHRNMKIISSADYYNGVLTINFNSDILPHPEELKENYTILNLSAMMSFNSVYSLRLFELLKSRAYNLMHSKNKSSKYSVSFSLSELKLLLGAVNANLDRVHRILWRSNPDYDKAIEVAEKNAYSVWGAFKKRVLDVAVKEINASELTDMTVSYSIKRAGRGGKVVGVDFTVTVALENIEEDVPGKLGSAPVGDVYEMVDKLLSEESVRYGNVKSIVDAADGDFAKVEEAYAMYKRQSEPDILTGWMVAAIRNGDKEDKEDKENKEKKENREYKEHKEYKGYIFTSDGAVYNSEGVRLSTYQDYSGSHYVSLYIPASDGRNGPRRYNLAKLLYQLYYGVDVTNTHVVCFKNENKNDLSVANLELVARGDYYKKIGWRRSSLSITDEQCMRNDYAVAKKKGKGSMRKLAKKYGCSLATVQRVIKTDE